MGSEVRAWVDGAMIDAHAPALAAVDHGVTVGDGVFETMKIVEGRAFAVTRHLRRLDRSLAGLGLDPADHDHLRDGMEAVLTGGAPIPFGRLRVTVTGGIGPLGSDRTGAPLTCIVSAAPSPRHQPTAAVATVEWTRNERSAVAGLKTTSYAENVVALAAAKAQGADEAILANTRGELCEGTGSNVFVVSGGVLRTPPLSSGCLAGITRELTIEWCREEGIEVVEEALAMSALAEADEVLITNSSRDVHPVSSVDGTPITAPGLVGERVAALFAERAAQEVDP